MSPFMILRIAAFYLIAIGLVGLVWPFLGGSGSYPEAVSLPLADLLKSFARELCLAAAFVIGGIGILKQQMWSRKVCLTSLGLAFFYGGNFFGWQWAGNNPSTQIIASAYGLSFVLFGLCFFVLFKHLNEKNLLSSR